MNDVSALYEQDYYLWLQENYQSLEKKEINRLDLPHLMEEIWCLSLYMRVCNTELWVNLGTRIRLCTVRFGWECFRG